MILSLSSNAFDTVVLNKSRYIIGKADNSDIQIDDESISHYHAMFFINYEGLICVQDLQSINGIFVNGEKIDNTHVVCEGDNITFGDIYCYLNEAMLDEEISIENLDHTVTSFSSEENKIYVPISESADDVLIDNEYCNIVFQEDHFTPISTSPLSHMHYLEDDYIQTSELEEAFDIKKETFGKCIQVTTLVSGSIIEQYYLPIKNKIYQASGSYSKTPIMLDLLSAKEKVPFITVNDNKIEVNSLAGFEQSHTSLLTTDLSKTIVLTNGTYQIFIELAEDPDQILKGASWIRDKEFIKQAGKTFASIMLPMLLLLLVDFTIDKPKEIKKLSIIYKQPTKSAIDGKTLSSKNPNSAKKNNGHKSIKQPKNKIARKKAGQPKKAKKAPKKTKVAKAAPPKPSKKQKAKPVVKAYKFKMASNVKSIFSTSKSISVSKSRYPSSITAKSAISGSASTKVAATSSGQVGNMGSDMSGTSASFGSQGLSSKKGMDTSYIQTKTVILGSMDPELLRKILQQYLPQFRHCYQQELTNNSEDIKGVVDLNFEIRGNGQAGRIAIKAKDARFSKKGIGCMASVLKIINFPKPKGGGRVAVRQPLNFFAENERG